MSMRNVGIYEQGAIFRIEDFDPAKVILVFSEKIYELTLPDDIKSALTANKFTVEIAAELCGLLDIKVDNIAEQQDYSCISDELISETDIADWFEGADPLMGTKVVSVLTYSDIEGEYIYDNTENYNEHLSDCFMFSLSVPFVWKIDTYNGCRTRDEALKLIKDAANALLKDDIDWDKRLGALIGSTMA